MYSEVEQSHLRYALRVYFIVGMFVLAIIGSQCCNAAAKLDLLRGKPVPLYQMTGWLHPKETFWCIWKLKRLPGGLWLGLMMCVASLVTIAGKSPGHTLRYECLGDVQFHLRENGLTHIFVADFATNSVKAVPTMGRCKFNQGLVVDFDQNKTVFSTPPNNGFPAVLASNAQVVSTKNGCDIGVYKKIPGQNDLSFCAGVDDIYGTWQCSDMNMDHNFPPTDLVEPTIRDWLVDAKIHDNSTLTWNDVETYDQTLSDQLIIWSIIFQNSTTTPVHVRVSIDMSVGMMATKTMKSFECNVTSPDPKNLMGLFMIIASVDGNETLSEWAPGLNAKVYKCVFPDLQRNPLTWKLSGTGAPANSNIPELSRNISAYLNAFTMVQGGSNSVVNTTLVRD
jgi:hypothetical protein